MAEERRTESVPAQDQPTPVRQKKRWATPRVRSLFEHLAAGLTDFVRGRRPPPLE